MAHQISNDRTTNEWKSDEARVSKTHPYSSTSRWQLSNIRNSIDFLLFFRFVLMLLCICCCYYNLLYSIFIEFPPFEWIFIIGYCIIYSTVICQNIRYSNDDIITKKYTYNYKHLSVERWSVRWIYSTAISTILSMWGSKTEK